MSHSEMVPTAWFCDAEVEDFEKKYGNSLEHNDRTYRVTVNSDGVFARTPSVNDAAFSPWTGENSIEECYLELLFQIDLMVEEWTDELSRT